MFCVASGLAKHETSPLQLPFKYSMYPNESVDLLEVIMARNWGSLSLGSFHVLPYIVLIIEELTFCKAIHTCDLRLGNKAKISQLDIFLSFDGIKVFHCIVFQYKLQCDMTYCHVVTQLSRCHFLKNSLLVYSGKNAQLLEVFGKLLLSNKCDPVKCTVFIKWIFQSLSECLEQT